MLGHIKRGWLNVILILVLGMTFTAIPQKNTYATTYTVTNTNDSGSGSLRQAILDANTHGGADTIAFNIPLSDGGYSAATGVFTINLLSTLTLSGDLTFIDGHSQSDNQGNTNSNGFEIAINGVDLATAVFTITGDLNSMTELCINGGSFGILITDDANENWIDTNIIGLDADAAVVVGNQNGIIIDSASDLNQISYNTIAGNSFQGVIIYNSDVNILNHNYIGTNGTSTDLGNDYNGIYIMGTSTGNIIGGSNTDHNIISSNGLNGVLIDGASGNEISYNHIGSSHGGTYDLGNGENGIKVIGGADNTVISYNQISGNGQSGVYVSGSGTDLSSIYLNTIGSDPGVTTAIGNGNHGVAIYDGPTNSIVQSNVIVANEWSGVVFQNADGNSAYGNYIGTDSTGSVSTLGNTYYGIHLTSSESNVAGGKIAYNGSTGIRVDGGVGEPAYPAIHNRISEVSIYNNNGGLGGDGIDNVDGGNNNASGPTVTDLSCVHVSGNAPGSKTVVEIFSSFHGNEGKTFEGSAVTDDLGNFSWDGYMSGPYISLTWTDTVGTTSEYYYTNNYYCYYTRLPLILK